MALADAGSLPPALATADRLERPARSNRHGADEPMYDRFSTGGILLTRAGRCVEALRELEAR